MRVVALLLCVVARAATAQSPTETSSITEWPIAAGSRVRIASPVLGKTPLTGNVVSATADTLVFRPAKDTVGRSIATPTIARIEVASGKHTQKLKGALLGLFLGAGAGAIVGAATYAPSKCTGFCMDLGRGFDAAVAGTLGGIAGTVVGLIVGSHERDTWIPVAVPAR